LDSSTHPLEEYAKRSRSGSLLKGKRCLFLLIISSLRCLYLQDDRGESTRYSLSTDEVLKLTQGFPESAVSKEGEEEGEGDLVEGEVDVFIKNKPTIAELAAAERAREKESGFVIESSESEGETEIQRPQRETSRLTKNATIIHSGFFYKQGQVRKNWKQRYFELWFACLSFLSPLSFLLLTDSFSSPCLFLLYRSTGVLLYKEAKDSVGTRTPTLSLSSLTVSNSPLLSLVQRGRIDLKASTITRLEVFSFSSISLSLNLSLPRALR
jgi:hypothetical protein